MSKVFVLAIVQNKRISKSVLQEVNKKISFICKNNNFMLVDNSNISNDHLFGDGIHMVELGWCILANNVIDY